jgi:hypothetical protein
MKVKGKVSFMSSNTSEAFPFNTSMTNHQATGCFEFGPSFLQDIIYRLVRVFSKYLLNIDNPIYKVLVNAVEQTPTWEANSRSAASEVLSISWRRDFIRPSREGVYLNNYKNVHHFGWISQQTTKKNSEWEIFLIMGLK